LRTEMERDGRRLVRTGTGWIVVDAEHTMISSYRFSGDLVAEGAVRERALEGGGTWRCSGERTFEAEGSK